MCTFNFDFRVWVGGKKKNGGHFAYFEGGHMKIGSNHIPMTKIERDRFFSRFRAQKGRLIN